MRSRLACLWGGAICAVLAVALSNTPAGAELYQYKDDQGHTHFVESVNQIPEKYRGQVRDIDGKEIPAFQPSKPPAKPVVPAAVKDSGGRSEEYWCGRKKDLDRRILKLEEEVRRLESLGAVDLGTPPAKPGEVGTGNPAGFKAMYDIQQELEQKRKDLETARKEREGLSEEARKAGALPGWLRDNCNAGSAGKGEKTEPPADRGSLEARRQELEKRIGEAEKKLTDTGGTYDPVVAARNADIQADIDRMKEELAGIEAKLGD